MKSASLTISVIITTVALNACAPLAGREFDTTYVKDIKPGVTTKADVTTNLGQPVRIMKPSTGEIWMYHYNPGSGVGGMMAKLSGLRSPMEFNTQSLLITFEGDTVQDYSLQE